MDLTIKRINDELVEGNEFYFLKIVPGSLHDRVKLDSPNCTKIILVDNDGKCYYVLISTCRA